MIFYIVFFSIQRYEPILILENGFFSACRKVNEIEAESRAFERDLNRLSEITVDLENGEPVTERYVYGNVSQIVKDLFTLNVFSDTGALGRKHFHIPYIMDSSDFQFQKGFTDLNPVKCMAVPFDEKFGICVLRQQEILEDSCHKIVMYVDNESLFLFEISLKYKDYHRFKRTLV